MDNIQDLNQSPIQIEGSDISGASGDEDNQEFQANDCEIFKGSFLMQMERMMRPLVFEKMPYSIFSLQYDEYEDNVLCFMEQEQNEKQCKFNIEIKQQQVEDYVLDFAQNSLAECRCNCHERQNHKNIKNVEQKDIQKEKVQTSISNEQKKSSEKNEPKRRRFQYDERKWTSISLKQYKQNIKKKLQGRKESS